jgi:RND superfamily putative drug exporter
MRPNRSAKPPAPASHPRSCFWPPGLRTSSPPQQRDGPSLAVQPNASASALRITVIGPAGPNDARTRTLHRLLQQRAAELARLTGASVAVGGQPAEFSDFRDAVARRAPWLIAAMVLATALVLAAVFRSLVLPLVAVALNMLAVGAAFGAIRLLFNGAPPPLGGPGFVDAVSIVAAFTVAFGLSVDYQVFILARIRERYLETADAQAAVAHALTRTAAIVTGAAAIMIAVFIAFAVAPTIAIRQLGTALVIAVALDASIVRLVLLPAIARLLGDRLWWTPRLRRSCALPAAPATQDARR